MASENQILSREMILSAYKAALHLSRALYKSAPFYAKQSQFPKSQMNVNLYNTRDYENKSDWTLGKNKPNSNPNKANFKIPDRLRSLSSSENDYNANGSTCKRLDICGVLT
ncbi:MAG: hypothetical protein ACYTBX_05390 [Planctomycetota bacterium]|jgi:hypothetical protein